MDIANTGTDITSLPEFQQADVIHLHWINQGMLSLRNIEKILASGKPVVWTMHDMWPCTGICHHARECTRYRQECHNCPFIHGGGGKRDLSYRIFRKKQNLYRNRHINFVTCSRWLEERARTSALFCGHAVTCIPNPINTNLFKPRNRQEARSRCLLPQDKKLMLFGSVKITDKRKGIDYLIESCRLLADKHPELREQLGVVVFGNQSQQLENLLPFKVYPLNFVSNEHQLVNIYNAVDIFVTPLAGREPAEHHHGSHGMRHSLRRIQRGRHPRDDRPSAQRLRGTIQILGRLCQRHLLDADRTRLPQPLGTSLPESHLPLFGERRRQEIH